MTQDIIPSGSDAPIPPKSAPDWADLGKLEHDLVMVNGLNNLAAWIRQARQFARTLDEACRSNPAMAQALKDSDVWWSFDENWGKPEDEGMDCLHWAIGDYLTDAGKATGMSIGGRQ